MMQQRVLQSWLSAILVVGAFVPAIAYDSEDERVRELDRGCNSCHSGIEKMHLSGNVQLACVDCHGGNADVVRPQSAAPEGKAYLEARDEAHVQPRYPKEWWRGDRDRAANPERTYTLLLKESPEFIKFVNPGDLRIAEETCGDCHLREVYQVKKSTMTTSSIFWAAASYANGILPWKVAHLGESYSRDGKPQLIRSDPTPEEKARGALEQLLPLPRWEVVQPGEYFRVFERGGLLNPSTFPEIGNPNIFDEAGKPDTRVSNRGRGTGVRVSPAVINLHKTRLNDPHLSFLGTNDQPGDFRSSGCTACHVVYANDRDPLHSGPWVTGSQRRPEGCRTDDLEQDAGNMGHSQTGDPTIPKDVPGHPIQHRLTRAIPTSQCMSCHMHQPNAFLNTYLGYTMWDYETDGELLWPEKQLNPSEAEQRKILERNPEGAAVRGLWGDVDFLENLSCELNPKAQHTQFADYHGHGWVFRAVYKRDRKGNLLDKDGDVVPFNDPDRFKNAVHLQDIHLAKGMHCVDCHFAQDAHGTGLLLGGYAEAIEIRCEDCHGNAESYASLRTSGPAAPDGGTNLELGSTPSDRSRFRWRETPEGRKLFQRSMLGNREWEVSQVRDSVTPGHKDYNAKAARAKTMQADGSWGTVRPSGAVHGNDQMTCYSCHTSWMTSCSGCHLPQRANVRSTVQHFEGDETRNFASYNPQVIRTDMFMLGVNSTVSGNKIAPVRSSSALVLSSVNPNRQRIYTQQPPISASGFSSQAFNPHVPHTVRKEETRTCTDCHVSNQNDNNAWLTGVLTLGTNFPNLIGRFAWVGLDGSGIEAVGVTEFEEPQPVIGSNLHRLAFPDNWKKHQKRKLELKESHHHHGHGRTNTVQLRGEFLFAAMGEAGLKVYDVANIDNKDFSERIVTAPVSPLGQRTYIKSHDATAVALPTTMPVAPARTTSELYPENQEQAMHPIYHFAFVSDSVEGLIVVNVDTLVDGDPLNNFLQRSKIYGEKSYNPDGVLTGARNVIVAGNHVYVVTDSSLVVIDFSRFEQGTLNPEPRVVAVLDEFDRPTDLTIQFRYLFVTDFDGLAVVDVTDPAAPSIEARLPMSDARSIYVARTYAYIAGGRQGLIIVDIERPTAPRIDQIFNADGKLTDVCDVKVASTAVSLFAYIADGVNGLRVLQLTSPQTVPGYLGFSPRPVPQLIATKHTHGRALSISKGLDRDRAVDESGNQVSVFNRIGSRPFVLDEMQRLYLRNGKLYTVSDEVETRTSSTSGAPAVAPSDGSSGQEP